MGPRAASRNPVSPIISLPPDWLSPEFGAVTLHFMEEFPDTVMPVSPSLVFSTLCLGEEKEDKAGPHRCSPAYATIGAIVTTCQDSEGRAFLNPALPGLVR